MCCWQYAAMGSSHCCTFDSTHLSIDVYALVSQSRRNTCHYNAEPLLAWCLYVTPSLRPVAMRHDLWQIKPLPTTVCLLFLQAKLQPVALNSHLPSIAKTFVLRQLELMKQKKLKELDAFQKVMQEMKPELDRLR